MSPTKCASHHFGPWMIEPEWFSQSVAAIRAGVLVPEGKSETVRDDDGYSVAYTIHDGGVAIVPIEGAMMKIRSKFGGTSTVDVRNALRKAVADDRVSSILLHVDSPGGTVAGTESLAQDVAAANRVKPVHAHIEDMGASAAYYVASQARRITASKGSLVGSLGVRMAVIDSKEYFEKQGLVIHNLATGEFKAAGAEGSEITDRQMEYFQGIVNDALGHFKAAVTQGRGFTQERTDALFDGKVHDAETAKQLGLIDEVSTLDAAIQAISQEVRTMTAEQFRAHAAANPEAEEVKEVFTKGHSAGMADAQKRMGELEAAAPGRPQVAIDAFKLGQSVETVKVTAAALDKAEADHKAALTAKDKEIAQLRFAAGSQGAVGTSGAAQAAAEKANAAADGTYATPQEQAKAEWAADANIRAGFASEAVYVAARSIELGGKVSFSKKQ
jgi:signal peptide peptidase SppA